MVVALPERTWTASETKTFDADQSSTAKNGGEHMNRREIIEMRRRLAARSAGEGEDHPILLAMAGILFALVFILASFL